MPLRQAPSQPEGPPGWLALAGGAHRSRGWPDSAGQRARHTL